LQTYAFMRLNIGLRKDSSIMTQKCTSLKFYTVPINECKFCVMLHFFRCIALNTVHFTALRLEAFISKTLDT